MIAADTASESGRLANISAALLLADSPASEHRAACTRLLSKLFEEVNVIPHSSDGPIAGILSALEVASEPRVLVVAEGHELFSADLLLALCAWAEAAVVTPRREGRGEPHCSLYRVREVLPAARRFSMGEEGDLHAWLDTFECGNLEGEDLLALLPPDASSASGLRSSGS